MGAAGEHSEVVITTPVEVDFYTSGQLAESIAQACALQPDRVVVDFSRNTFCDTAALDVLLEAAAKLQADGCSLQIRSPSKQLRLIARVLGLSEDLGLPVQARRLPASVHTWQPDGVGSARDPGDENLPSPTAERAPSP